jgi:hypothetical protein
MIKYTSIPDFCGIEQIHGYREGETEPFSVQSNVFAKEEESLARVTASQPCSQGTATGWNIRTIQIQGPASLPLR